MKKPIPGFEGYWITDDCEIWSIRCSSHTKRLRPEHPHKLSIYKTKDGRHYTFLYTNGKSHNFLVGRLMLMAFVGLPPQENYECCHGPKGITIDTLDNLYWGTPSQNCLDRVRDGTDHNGDKHPQAKLTWEQVREMRRLHEQGVSTVKLGRQFHVRQTSAWNVVNYKTWRYDPHAFSAPPGKSN